MISISLCMIVKDEERSLRRCLDSLQKGPGPGLMDEIIIVDTGSSDATKRIAAEYTDKVYDFVWTGDFAEARNFAFSKASMDYVYSADADEALDESNRERFRILKETLLPEVDIVQMVYANQLNNGTVYNYDREYRPKLFKRLRTFQWMDPIHETIRLEPIVYDSEIEIGHYPSAGHGARDLEAFRRAAGEERLSRRLHGLYARELFITGKDEDFLAAVEVFTRSAADTERSLDEVKEACCVAARAARLQGDVGGLMKYALKDVASEGCSEICCELGRYFLDAGDPEEAAVWYYNAAYETASILDIRTGGKIPLLGLAECYGQLGNREEAEEYRRLAEEWKPEDVLA